MYVTFADALLTVKLDPAVLEAQVTVDTSANTTRAQQDDLTLAPKSKRKGEWNDVQCDTIICLYIDLHNITLRLYSQSG